MKIIAFALPAACAAALAACGSQPTVEETNASVEEVSEKVREASRDRGLIRPGKWVSSVTIEEMSMPGMPPQAAEQMKRMVAETHSSEQCLTAEDVKQPNLSGNENCRYDHFTMTDGRIDARMRCEGGGSTQVMEMAGTYSPDSYEMRMKSRAEGGPGQAIQMQMKVEAKRVGECTADKA